MVLQRIDGGGNITRKKQAQQANILLWMPDDVTFDLNYDFNSMWSQSCQSHAPWEASLCSAYIFLIVIAGRFHVVFFFSLLLFISIFLCLCSQAGSWFYFVHTNIQCLYMGCPSRVQCVYFVQVVFFTVLYISILHISSFIYPQQQQRCVYKFLLFLLPDFNSFRGYQIRCPAAGRSLCSSCYRLAIRKFC